MLYMAHWNSQGKIIKLNIHWQKKQYLSSKKKKLRSKRDLKKKAYNNLNEFKDKKNQKNERNNNISFRLVWENKSKCNKQLDFISRYHWFGW